MTAAVRARSPQPAALVGAAAAVGLAFNAARVAIHLDAARPAATFAAFVALGAVGLALARSGGLGADLIGVRAPAARRSIAGGVLVLAAMVGPALLTAGHVTAPPLGALVGSGLLYLLAVAPAEELLFRGVLQGAASVAFGAPAAVGLSAAAFALAHVPVYGVGTLPLAFAAGLMLGWLRWWSRSLAAPVVIHALADLTLLWL